LICTIYNSFTENGHGLTLISSLRPISSPTEEQKEERNFGDINDPDLKIEFASIQTPLISCRVISALGLALMHPTD
jgi:hypothetical protein